MNIINLLNKRVVLYKNEKLSPIIFEPEGPIQVRMKVENLTEHGIVKRGYWTHTRDLPAPHTNTLYIVSSLVAMFELFENNRRDLVFPWGMVRGESGEVFACKSLCQPHHRPAGA